MYEFAVTAIAKCHRLGCMKNRHLFCHSSRAWKSEIMVSQGWSLLRTVSWVYRWPSSPCLLPMYLCVLTSFSYKTTSQIGLGSTLMTSFNISHPCIGPTSKYSHIWMYRALEHRCLILWGHNAGHNTWFSYSQRDVLGPGCHWTQKVTLHGGSPFLSCSLGRGWRGEK